MSDSPPRDPHGGDEPGRPDDDLNGPDERTAPEHVAPAAAAAPTATTTRVPGRRRRVALALVLLVLGVAAVAGVVFLSGDYRQERLFKKRAEAVMELLRDGKAQQVYDEASSRFQQTLLIDKFVDLVDRMNGTLGPFVRAGEVTDIDRAASVAGMIAGIQLELQFDSGETMGKLSFHRGPDGVWRLLGLSVEIPPELEKKASALESQEERVRAPKEVETLVQTILQDVREGRADQVHEGASPVFKGSVTLEEFKGVLQSHRAELGNFVRVLGIISSAQSPDRDRARVQAVLEYERGKTTGTFEFMRLDAAWRLLGFKVVIPFGETQPDQRPL